MPTAATLEGLLAGTQCTQCGYPSCAAYAQALESGEKPTLCRPGGSRVATALAQALNLPPQPPAQAPLPPQVALVDESTCIGCTLCLKACPTGAIVGSNKQLHTVMQSLCTGCGLCLPPCPVDCIVLQPSAANQPLTVQQADGSLTPAASAQTWALVQAHNARRTPTPRAQKQVTSTPYSPPLQHLPADVLAKAAAARQKSRAKYAAKGPLKPLRGLPK
ncbi:MAG: RnfABCDGE type electron transport complex subunit B [Proteobacteria bacterium]|nr:RnfABCDGE type electron transport complex subunit B [Pseudomonadota bacterium]